MLTSIVLISIVTGIVYSWVAHLRASAVQKSNLTRIDIEQRLETILHKEVGLYRYLPAELQDRLQQRTQLFLNTIAIRSVQGMPELSDRMKIGVAGQACLLLLSESHRQFHGVSEVVVYPGFNDYDNMAGHSSFTGRVTVAIGSSRLGGRTHNDGYNVVLHEFAHQLDFDGLFFRGIPRARRTRDLAEWIICISRERKRFAKGEATELFAALRTHPHPNNPRELFSHGVEHFFERPHVMRREHQKFYRLLQEFFQLNPAQLFPER